MTVLIYPDTSSLTTMTVARLCLALADAGALREQVHLAVAGGSVGTGILGTVPNSPLSEHVNWHSVHLWWVDERFVPLGHGDRNDAALDDVFSRLPLPDANIHRMPSPATASGVHEGAQQYAAELAEFAADGAALPLFDVVLLGMGPDGHVASLFPGHEGLQVDQDGESSAVTLGVTDSPKPPAERISMSQAAINHTRKLWVAAWGEEKAPAIAGALRGADVAEIPAAGARGQEETLWLTDLAGSADL